MFIVIRYICKRADSLYIIIVGILRILAMKDLTKSTYVTVCKTRILILYESSAFLFRRRFDHRRIIHDNTSQDISSLTVFVHIFGIDLADLALAIYIVLIDIPGRTAPQPAGGAIFASTSTVHGIPDNFLALFFCRILYEYRSILHISHPQYATAST